jgi:hypothetical protein
MTGIRYSIRALVFAVLLVAATCAYGRLVFENMQSPVSLGLLGSLLMLNLLAIGTYRLLCIPGARRPFLVGFLLAGLGGVYLVLPLSEALRERFGWFWLNMVYSVGPFSELFRAARNGDPVAFAGMLLSVVVLINLLMTPPLLLFATLGGLLARLVSLALHSHSARGATANQPIGVSPEGN